MHLRILDSIQLSSMWCVCSSTSLFQNRIFHRVSLPCSKTVFFHLIERPPVNTCKPKNKNPVDHPTTILQRNILWELCRCLIYLMHGKKIRPSNQSNDQSPVRVLLTHAYHKAKAHHQIEGTRDYFIYLRSEIVFPPLQLSN